MEAKASFPTQLRELPQIFLWLQGHLAQLQCDPPCIRKLELAVEEAVVNVIRHSKSDRIEIHLKGEAKKQVEITIRDKGFPFNPLEVASLDPSISLEERKEGGLGIFLMRQVVDNVHYKREGDFNVLVLKKKL